MAQPAIADAAKLRRISCLDVPARTDRNAGLYIRLPQYTSAYAHIRRPATSTTHVGHDQSSARI